jgi:hypothetical protein
VTYWSIKLQATHTCLERFRPNVVDLVGGLGNPPPLIALKVRKAGILVAQPIPTMLDLQRGTARARVEFIYCPLHAFACADSNLCLSAR